LGFSPPEIGDTAEGGNTNLSTCASAFGITLVLLLLVLPLADKLCGATILIRQGRT
jgi:hypothetical protein